MMWVIIGCFAAIIAAAAIVAALPEKRLSGGIRKEDPK